MRISHREGARLHRPISKTGRLSPSYWRTPSGVEIDFVWTRGDTAIAFELKSTSRWQRGYSSVLRRCMAENMISRAFGIYNGPHVLRDGQVEILPIQEFLRRLWTGQILHAGLESSVF
jgi:predicted AAA+ superfamily ATPase